MLSLTVESAVFGSELPRRHALRSALKGHYLCHPPCNAAGNLPLGIHWASWKEFEERFGTNAHRKKLLKGVKQAAAILRAAGCKAIYVDGSFVTNKKHPDDFDACWSLIDVDLGLLDPVLFDLSSRRAAPKSDVRRRFFPAEWIEGGSGKSFLELFQIDKRTGKPKGIVGIRLGRASPRKRT